MSVVTRIFWSVVATGYIAVCMLFAITALLTLAPLMWVLRIRRYVLLLRAQAQARSLPPKLRPELGIAQANEITKPTRFTSESPMIIYKS
jgi:hypothetical protein